MIVSAPTFRAAPVGVRYLLAGTSNLRGIRMSGSSDGAAPAPAAPPAPSPAAPPENPAPGSTPADALVPGEPGASPADTDTEADPATPKKADTPSDQPGDPAEVADACVAAGRPELAAGFIRSRASMAAVKGRLLVNSAPIYARMNGRQEPVNSMAAAPGRRVDASATYARLNGWPSPVASTAAAPGASVDASATYGRLNAATRQRKPHR